MSRKPKKNSASNADVSEDGGHLLTSGDMARLLHVDLKTIHNWVNQGHLTGRRTQGRHLRFDRTEVVRFMRAYGYPIPDAVGASAPRVVIDQAEGSKLGSLRALKRSLSVTTCRGLFACGLLVAAGDQEMVIVDLDKRDMKQLEQFVAAIRQWPACRGLLLVGVGQRPALRRSFLRAGGDVALPASKESDLRALANWLTGGSDQMPGAAEFPAAD